MGQSIAAAVIYLNCKILITRHPPNSRREIIGHLGVSGRQG